MHADVTPHTPAATPAAAPTQAPGSVPGHAPGHPDQQQPGAGHATWSPAPAPAFAATSTTQTVQANSTPSLGMYDATGDPAIDRMLQLERALKARAPLT